MLQNPDIQRKAQKVIDETMNLSEGLPDFTHYGKMPYIEALVQEVFRWRPVAPIAVPHRVIQDDVYEGYHIPAGATVIPNSWALAHDPAHYGWNPSKFDPTRFLNESQTAINPSMPMGYEAFGYGRRICPGLHIAVETVWLAIVSILAVFNIEPVEGTDVSELDRYTSGLILHPLPFKCKFVPRSEVAVQAVREG
ncbi:cytochrome P450 [Coprinopsis cinerea AmutBmut pab1-1]|nr:cytochrome P450 [Coprinopsis cinerea AmutBmut pab1-1]